MTTVYTTHPRYVEHDFPGHPEHAGRIKAVWNTLEKAGLTARMKAVEPGPASDEQILAVHTREYLDLLRQISLEDGPVRFDADTYALPESPEVARLSAGGVIRAVDEVLNGDADNGLAVVRPPGHHALSTRGMGFCLLGNVAIAARRAQRAHDLRRVLIVDFDVHHGNGTQDMFYDDDSVLFISTHQYPFYPGTGSLEETGTGRGAGYTINIPLPANQGDGNYAIVFERIVWPAARRFQPDLVLVSAGFDAHWTDPLALMRLTLTGYAHLTRELISMAQELCGGRIVFVMEGGYDLETLGHGVRNIAHALLGEDEISDPLGGGNQQEPDISPLLDRILRLHGL
jgi:acetoin utilization deacetylase AcuC-like enzyme